MTDAAQSLPRRSPPCVILQQLRQRQHPRCRMQSAGLHVSPSAPIHKTERSRVRFEDGPDSVAILEERRVDQLGDREVVLPSAFAIRRRLELHHQEVAGLTATDVHHQIRARTFRSLLHPELGVASTLATQLHVHGGQREWRRPAQLLPLPTNHVREVVPHSKRDCLLVSVGLVQMLRGAARDRAEGLAALRPSDNRKRLRQHRARRHARRVNVIGARCARTCRSWRERQ